MTKKPNSPTITRLMERAISFAGSEAKLGVLTGYSQNAIWYAKRNGRVSAELAIAIDRVTSGVISKAEMRPDVFPATPAELSRQPAEARL